MLTLNRFEFYIFLYLYRLKAAQLTIEIKMWIIDYFLWSLCKCLYFVYYIYVLSLIIFRSFLELFTTMELIQWKELSKDYEKELKSGPLATDVFSENTEKGNKRWADLKNRVAEHVRIKITFFF